MRVLPLVWESHHVRENGWYGLTVTGALVVYVYQPHGGARYKWAVYQYWGANPDREGYDGEVIHPKDGKPRRYTLPGQAKRAAQEYWKRQMRQLIEP